MYRLMFFCCLAIGLWNCGSSVLDYSYDPSNYKSSYQLLAADEGVSEAQLHQINYTIVRQRDYLGYSVEGKTFGELLAMATTFQQDGIGVEEVYNRNGEQPYLQMKVRSEGAGMVRKGQSSRLLKVLKFECIYTNTSKDAVALETSSFILKGPFGQHLMTLGYELNCQIAPGASLKAYFMVEGKLIRNNLIFGSPRSNPYLGIDWVFQNIEIESSGNTVVKENVKNYNQCNFDGMRAKAFQHYSYITSFEKDNPGLSENNDGTQKINLGDAHFIVNDSDEPVELFELVQ